MLQFVRFKLPILETHFGSAKLNEESLNEMRLNEHLEQQLLRR